LSMGAKSWRWQNVVTMILAVVFVWVALPFATVYGFTVLMKTPSFAYDLWRTHYLGETWALWADYGSEITYSAHQVPDRQAGAPRRQKTREACETLRVARLRHDEQRDLWWRDVGYPQCVRERQAECHLSATKAQGMGLNYAGDYALCMLASICPEPGSLTKTEYVCLPVDQLPAIKRKTLR
jgi:hypothetical protein